MEQRPTKIPNSSLPGCSLEDHDTNVISLTELNGINWIQLVPSQRNAPYPLDQCPVVEAYNICRKQNLIVHYRRRPALLNSNSVPTPALDVDAYRELWIFWYESKPEVISTFSKLEVMDENCWPSLNCNGLEYNIRCLFLQALHERIAVALSKHQVFRFGRWFSDLVDEPLSRRLELVTTTVNAFRFEFMVAGNCVNVIVHTQVQPALLKLNKRIVAASASQPVILSPWGIKAILMPNQSLSSSNVDDSSERVFNDSNPSNLASFAGLYTTPEKDKPGFKKEIETIANREFAIFEDFCGNLPHSTNEDLPKMLYVQVNGISFLYPSCLIAVVVDELVKDQPIQQEESEGEGATTETADDFESLEEPFEIDFLDDFCSGCRASRKMYEEAMTKPDKNRNGWNCSDLTQKGEFCTHCGTTEEASIFLPSVLSAPSNMNPSTPHDCPSKLSEPPSIPPTSIESVASVFADFKRKPWNRYKPPSYPAPVFVESKESDYREPHMCEQINSDIEDLKRSDALSRNSWTYPQQNDTVVCFADGEPPMQCDFSEVFAPLMTENQWDDVTAPERRRSPFTPINCVTPPVSSPTDSEYEIMQRDAENNCYEHNWQLRDSISPCELHLDMARDKPLGLCLCPPQSSPIATTTKTPILEHLLNFDDDDEENYQEEGTPASAESTETDDYEGDDDRGYDMYPDYRTLEVSKKRQWPIMDIVSYRNSKHPRLSGDLLDIGRIGVTITDADFGIAEFPDEDDQNSPRMPNHAEPHQQEMLNFEAQIQKIPNPIAQPGLTADVEMADEASTSEVPADSDRTSENAVSLDKQPAKALLDQIVMKTTPLTVSQKRAMEIRNKLKAFHSNKRGVERQQDLVEEVRRNFLPCEPSVSYEEYPDDYLRYLYSEHVDGTNLVDYEFYYMTRDALRFVPDSREIATPRLYRGNIFYDNVFLPEESFAIIDARNALEPIPDAPQFVKRQVFPKKKTFNLDLNEYYNKEHEFMSLNRQRQEPLQRQAVFQNVQRQGLRGPSYGSPQINGIGQLNMSQQTPSPLQQRMNAPGSFMMAGSIGAGGSVQMSEMSPSNGFNLPMPPLTSTPNFVKSPPLNRPGTSMTTPGSWVQNGFPMSALADGPYNPVFDVVENGVLPVNTQQALSHIFVFLLKDTTLDLHYDVVFDSCPICSCRESIRTSEYGVYLTISPEMQTIENLQRRDTPLSNTFSGFIVKNAEESCMCAFSAVRHRYSCETNSNLFADDIREATGAPPMTDEIRIGIKWFNPLEQKSWRLMDLVRWYTLGHDIARHIQAEYRMNQQYFTDQFKTSGNSGKNEFEQFDPSMYRVSGNDQNGLEFVVSSALEAAIFDDDARKLRNGHETTPLIHPWGVQEAISVQSPIDQMTIGIMKRTVEALEEVAREVHPTTPPGTVLVDGPLNWKAFHRKATKMFKSISNEIEDETHQPEPIPNIVLGTDKDMVMTIPSSLWAWERSGYSPFSWPKNVVYMAVVPDQSVTIEKCRLFLEDLSMTYEKHKLGRHVPLPNQPCNNALGNGVSDALLRVTCVGAGSSNMDFNRNSSENAFLHRLNYYIRYYRDTLTKFLQSTPSIFAKKSFHEGIYRDYHSEHYTAIASELQPQPTQLPSVHHLDDSTIYRPPVVNLSADNKPVSPDEVKVVNQQSDDPMHDCSIKTAVEQMGLNDETTVQLPHIFVIYIINPFAYGLGSARAKFAKISFLALLKSFDKVLNALEVSQRCRIQFEIVDIQTVFNYAGYSSTNIADGIVPLNIQADSPTSCDILKEIAFNIYTQPRQLTPNCIRDILCKTMTRFGPASQIMDILDGMQREPVYFRVPTSPYILAPSKSALYEISPKGELAIKNPEDKVLFITYCLVGDEFLIASATDDRGEVLDTVTLNIARQTKSRNPVQAEKSQVSHVSDVLYRLWIFIQGRMAQDSKNWRLVIGRFGKMGHGEFKAWTSILSKKNLQTYNALLKGKDKELMTPAITPSAIQNHLNNNCKTCSGNPGYSETPALIGACLISTEAEPYLKVLLEYVRSDKLLIPLFDTSITHIMVFPTSPGLMDSGGDQVGGDEDNDDFFALGNDFGNDAGFVNDEEVMGVSDLLGDFETVTSNIPNQPVAVGYMVSTAPALDVPEWFWSKCPSSRNKNPVHLKSSLHLTVQHINQSDDYVGNVDPHIKDTHSLDSTASDVVLKYILQTYNELSWLNVDYMTGQRKSCLPIHIQHLVRLYNGLQELST